MEFQRYTAPDADALETSIAECKSKLATAFACSDAYAIVENAADLGSMLTTARQEATAASLLSQHLALARALPEQEVSGWFWNAYATALQYVGRRDEASEAFSHALALCKVGSWRKLQSFVLQHWGRCLVEMGQLSNAEQLFREALTIRRELNDPRQASTERALQAVLLLRSKENAAPPDHSAA
jgi:tetratricopeptide (TPR) repeat protein